MKVHNTIYCNFSFPVDQQHVEECPGIKHCAPALKGTKMKKIIILPLYYHGPSS